MKTQTELAIEALEQAIELNKIALGLIRKKLEVYDFGNEKIPLENIAPDSY